MILPFAHKIDIDPECRFAFEDEIESHKNVGTQEAEDKFFDTGSKSLSVAYFEDRLENIVGAKFGVVDEVIQNNHSKIKKLSEEEMNEFFKENDVKYTMKQLKEIQKTKFPIDSWVLEATKMKNLIDEKINKNEIELNLINLKKLSKNKNLPSVKRKKKVNMLQELEIKEQENTIFVSKNKTINSISFLSNEDSEKKNVDGENEIEAPPPFRPIILNESQILLVTEENLKNKVKVKSHRGNLFRTLRLMSSNDELEVPLEQIGELDRQPILKIDVNDISPIKFNNSNISFNEKSRLMNNLVL